MDGDVPKLNWRWRGVAGLLAGVVLLLAAVIVIARQHGVVAEALAAVTPPSPGLAALLLAAVAANIVLSGALFSILMSPYGRVGRLEMQALIATTALVNYLPLRPGLVGRVTYHKAVNGIAVMDSARAVVQGLALSIVIAIYTAGMALAAIHIDIDLRLGVLLPFLLAALLSLVRPARLWCWAGLVRYCELLVWAVRYFAAFSLLGLEIEWSSALAFACISALATMVPLVSNGLGLREWAIGLVAPLLTAHQLSLGITAELVNRAAELVVVLVMGLCGMAYLARRRRTAADMA